MQDLGDIMNSEKGMEGVKENKHGQAQSLWFVAVVALFVACLIVANTMAVKVVTLFGLLLPAAIVIFPLSYIAGDVLEEKTG